MTSTRTPGANRLGLAVRRCYVSDSLVACATDVGVHTAEIIASCRKFGVLLGLPGPG